MTAIWVELLNTLNITGQWNSPAAFLLNFNFIKPLASRGFPEQGFTLYFLMKGRMYSKSNTWPCNEYYSNKRFLRMWPRNTYLIITVWICKWLQTKRTMIKWESLEINFIGICWSSRLFTSEKIFPLLCGQVQLVGLVLFASHVSQRNNSETEKFTFNQTFLWNKLYTFPSFVV